MSPVAEAEANMFTILAFL
ncbi:hypothetical protein NU785_002813 [Vibrio parahaemolyticus]|nr:hypothetical protein [Vibrio parahaemolyticus]